MNRRAFLTGSGAVALAPLILTSKKTSAQASGVNPNIVGAATNSNTVALANGWANNWNTADWGNIIATHYALRNHISDNNLDQPFKDSVPDTVDPGAFDFASTTSMVQTYQPAFQESDLRYYYSLIPKDDASIRQACSAWRNVGIAGGCSSVISQSIIMQQAIQNNKSGGGQANFFGPNPPPNAPKPYNCAVDGALALMFGTAFVVIAIMAGPVGVLAMMAFWEPVILWGGTAAGAWALGHSMFCPF